MATSKAPKIPKQLMNGHAPIQAIYADRIMNVGIGSSVSRLTLAIEVGENVIAPLAQLVIPTPALFEALEQIATTITSNDEIKKSIIDSLDTFKEKISKTSK